MKKLIAWSVVLVLLICPVLAGSAEEGTTGFSPDWFRNKGGFVYSITDKLWYYSEDMSLSGSDGHSSVNVVFKIEGNDSSVFYGGPAIRFSYRNAEKRGRYKIEQVDLLIGETVFSYPQIPDNDRRIASVWVGEKDRDLFDALAGASAFSVRIRTESFSETFEITGEALSQAREFAAGMVEWDIWKYAADEYGLIPMLEEHFPLVRNDSIH